jgi:hypothetical protein
MTSELLASISGIVLSLLFSYVPGLSGKFAKLETGVKRLIMAGLILVVSGAAFGLSCGNIFPSVECSKEGALGLVKIVILTLVANQSIFAISPETNEVSDGKMSRYSYCEG